ncbi:MAG: hypothetical protein IJY20_07990 [Clostridia bacterium]|nr:hypothetical protein [Clostridia bacterium]
MTGKGYIHYFNKASMGVRAMCEDDVLIMPEIEHSAASRYRRSPRFMRFALETAIPLVLSGMTYSLYDFVANGTRDSFGYGAVVKEEQPFMQGVLDLGLRFSSLTGVVVPIDPRSCYYQEMKGERLEDLLPGEYHAAGYLSAMGISFRYSREKRFKRQIVLMTKWSIATFTDEELSDLFAENFVLLDGSGVLALQERSLLSLIYARSAANKGRDNGYHTYEECADKTLSIDGVRGLRASCRTAAGDFVEVDYIGGVSVKTEVYGYRMDRLAPAIVMGQGFAVIPYILNDNLLSQYCTLRRHFLLEAVTSYKAPVAVSYEEGVSPYLYLDGIRQTLILTNGNVDSFDEIRMCLPNVFFTEVYRLGRDGKKTPVRFRRLGHDVWLQTEIEYLSSTVLILE